MTTTERILKFLLRLAGSLNLLAIFAVFMPREWMAICHERLGLGTFPDGPLVDYLTRTLSAFYAMQGGLLWVISADVRRYAPAVLYLAVVGVLFGGAALAVDLHFGMPTDWTVGEGPFVIVFSLAIFFLQRNIPRPRRDAGTERQD